MQQSETPRADAKAECSVVYTDGRDEKASPDHDLDKDHHDGEMTISIIRYKIEGGLIPALEEFVGGFKAGTLGQSTSDDDRLLTHFLSGGGAALNFETSSDMARILGGAPSFTTFANGFEQTIRDYVAANDTLCGFDGNAYIKANRPAYFKDPLFAYAVLGGYSKIEASVTESAGKIKIRYKIYDHFGAGVHDAASILPGLPAMYYVQHFTSGAQYVPFIWSVEIERAIASRLDQEDGRTLPR